MRSPLLPLLALALGATGLLAAQDRDAENVHFPPGFHRLAIGDPAPDFSLLGIDGKTYSLADFKADKVLVVIFLSNHCPVSHACDSRFVPWVASLAGRSVGVIAINPNSPAGLQLEELGYSKYGDTYPEMKLYAKERHFNFPYVYDGKTQTTAKAYGCLCTPHMFVFDQDRRLKYEGQFDDSQVADPATVHATPGPDAVEAVLEDRPVAVAVTRPFGCSTKWATKRNLVAAGNEAWRNLPVSVESIDAAGLAALARNPSDRLRVINFWATWCVPCVEEFPGLVSISRRLESRDFDLITVSVDDPADRAKVLRFLRREHAAVPPPARKAVAGEGRRTNNYQLTYDLSKDAEVVAKAVDPQWAGGWPYTVVIAPGGEILYRFSGEMDTADLQSKLIDRLGLYYQ